MQILQPGLLQLELLLQIEAVEPDRRFDALQKILSIL